MPLPLDPPPARLRPSPGRVSQRAMWTGIDHGTIMGTELVVGILLYSFLGNLVDGWLGTAPWFLVIGALGGFASGLYLIWVRSARMEAAERRLREGDDRGR